MVTNIEGIHYRTLKLIRVEVSEGVISKIEEIESSHSDRLICPGLVDLQVNGFRGIDFNEESIAAADVIQVTQLLWASGVTSYFPTLITNSDKSITHSIRSILDACKQDSLTNSSIRGIHLEGPFLSKEDGPRGAHPLAHIQAPDWELFCKWQQEAEGKIKLITLSPEWPTSPEFIQKCVESGVKVAIGHTAASPTQIKDAVVSGASLSTHLGNAAHLMLPRHTNYIWEQLANEKLWCSIIADGFHLPEAVLKVFLKVKAETSILVSDATKFAGLPAGSYQSPIGGEVVLDDAGRLSLKDNPELLAGSAKSLLDCVVHLVKTKLLSFPDALDMASTKPMEFLGNSQVGLKVGTLGDLIVLEKKEDRITVVQTIKSGNRVHST